jgi:hypothetical protein
VSSSTSIGTVCGTYSPIVVTGSVSSRARNSGSTQARASTRAPNAEPPSKIVNAIHDAIIALAATETIDVWAVRSV